MALSSKMIPLGTVAPDFTLFNPSTGNNQSLNELKSNKGTLIIFICNHCPYVVHIAPKLSELAKNYISTGISVIAINSNDVRTYPEDSPEKMVEFSKKYGFSFPYLYDETQDAAREYNAACTPDIYLFDKEMQLVYRGQFDDSRPSNGIPVTGKDLSGAIENLLSGKPIAENQIPSIGCSIKWK